MAEAPLAQTEADLQFSEAQLENTLIRAPFTGVVVKKMAEVGESVAPIPPGVNISTASGAIVALADLDTLEVEADVAEVERGQARREPARRGRRSRPFPTAGTRRCCARSSPPPTARRPRSR